MKNITGPIRLGVIGAGGMGRGVTRELVAEKGVEVVAAADPMDDNIQALRELIDAPDIKGYTADDGYEKMLDECNLDAVGVFSPHSMHFDHAMAAMKAGVHVLLEKPMVVGFAKNVELVEYAEANDMLLLIGYQRHYESLYFTGREAIKSGMIGDVKRFRIFLAQDYNFTTSWRADPVMSGGGQINDSGSHIQDIFMWMTSRQPVRVCGAFDRMYKGEERAIQLNCDVDIELDNGAVGSLVIEGDHNGDFAERIVIEGSEGTLKFRAGTLYITKGTKTEVVPPAVIDGYPKGKTQNFIQCLRDSSAKNHCDARGVLQTTLLTQMILTLDKRTEVTRDEILEEAGLTLDRIS